MSISRAKIVAMVASAADPALRRQAERAGQNLADLVEAGILVPASLLRLITTPRGDAGAAAPPPRPLNSKAAGGGDGFSLIELVIVVVIIGVLAAIAVPRLARAAAGARDAALAATLSEFRSAIDRYAAEHGAYPSGELMAGNRSKITLQLTQYSDAAGNCSEVRTGTHRYGPYLRQIPGLAVGTRAGRNKINTSDTAGAGWIYDPATGEVRANTGSDTDAAGRPYSMY